MTRILLVDDHPVVRQGIKQVLSGAFHPALVGEAANAEEGMSEVRSTDWDVMVLDLSLPGASGMDLLKDLRRERPALPVLVLSMHPPDQFARRAMNAGASGYLTKDSAPTELVKAVGEVIAGRRYLNPAVIEELVLHQQPELSQRPHEVLSDREYQVLRMIASGLTVSQISTRLTLSVKTISTYRARVLEKMGMKTTAELMHYGIQHGGTASARSDSEPEPNLEPDLDRQLHLARRRSLRELAEGRQGRCRIRASAEDVVHRRVVRSIEEVEDLEDPVEAHATHRESPRQPQIDGRLRR